MTNRAWRLIMAMALVIGMGNVQSAKGQLRASFTVDVDRGCAPLLVRFTDRSTGGPTAWAWDFGNGITSTDPSPLAQIPFTTPGTTTVTLTVTNGVDPPSTYTLPITVLDPPKATITLVDSIGCFPFPVSFQSTVDPGSANIVSYTWDFGDGTPFSNATSPSHTYLIDGVFRPTLRIEMDNGCVKTFPSMENIRVAQGVTADFFYPVVPTCKPPINVSFQNLSSGPGTLTYQWDFGNGSTSTNRNDVSQYNSGGRYDVQLITTSDVGCVDTVVKSINLPTSSVQSAFTAPDTVCLGQVVDFRNTSAPDPDSSFWSFGDGTFSNLLTPANKSYSTSGNFTVKLVNKFGACVDSFSKVVVIPPSPTPSFTSSGVSSCRTPFPVTFTNTTPGSTNPFWVFSNGITATFTASGNNPTVNFRDTGAYDIVLTVEDQRGCTTRQTFPKFIKVAPLRINLTNVPDSGCAPFTLRPRLTASSIDGIASYLWTWGDGATDTDPNATHLYSSTGTYNPTLRITTNSGCDTLITPGVVKVGTLPSAADFTASPVNACAGTNIQFNDITGGAGITGWQWDFGDGTFSSFQNPIHVYSDTGIFSVMLTVFNNGCGQSVAKADLMNIGGAVARFNFTVDCQNKLLVSFRDSSLNANTWDWDFDDGTVYSGQFPPPHLFPAKRDYHVSLTVTNGSCSFKQTTIVHVVSEPADFLVNPNPLCRGIAANFGAVNSTATNISKYEWDFGTGAFTVGTRTASSLYTNSGIYNTRLRITDINGCRDSSIQVLSVGGPKAGLGAVNPTGCKGITVDFIDSTRTDGINAIVSRFWDFGDGTGRQQINSGPVSHAYPNAGTYNVKLVVVDAGGCADSITLRNFVTTSEPKAKISVSDTVACPGTQIQFKAMDAGSINNFQWKFGDGGTSTFAETFHPYNTVGNYTVQLKIRDRYGCEDSTTATDLIRIDTPFAAFDVSDTAGSCPPLKVDFTFRGSFYKSYKWVFGDSANSVELNPSHNYSRAGTYTAMLILTSPGGCQDTARQVIRVRGPNGYLTFTPQTGCPGTQVDFTLSNPTDIDSLLWNFGDSTALNTQFSISHIYSQPATNASGQFKDYPVNVTLIDQFKCRVTIYGPDSTVRIVGVKAAFGADRTVLCANGFVQFTDSSTTNGVFSGRLWNFGDGNTSTDINPQHYYASPGLYTVTMTATTAEGCSDTRTMTNLIAVVAPPDIAIQSSLDSLCRNGIVTFRGIEVTPDTSALRWSWDFANGQTSTLKDPVPQNYTVAGDLPVTLIATNSTGCQDTAIHIVHVQPLPSTDAGLDSTICLGQSVQLTATGANSYQWQPPVTGLSCTNCPDPVATPTINTLYIVRGSTAFGCTNTDSVWVYVIQPSTVVAPPNDSLCYTQGLRLVATGTQVYSWSPATGLSDPNAPNPLARPTTTTTYTVTGSDYKGCFVSTDSVLVTVFPIPQVNIGRDTTISVGASIQLTALVSPDVRGIQWQPTSTLSCLDCLDPVARPSTSTTYQAIVTNDGGCSMMDEIRVNVICNNANIFMPNTFSPNGDGMNDVYYPRGHGVQAVRSLRIFNRWGQLMYERQNFNANDASMAWDGRFHGTALPPDVYVYIMEYVCENGVIVAQKGDITLVR